MKLKRVPLILDWSHNDGPPTAHTRTQAQQLGHTEPGPVAAEGAARRPDFPPPARASPGLSEAKAPKARERESVTVLSDTRCRGSKDAQHHCQGQTQMQFTRSDSKSRHLPLLRPCSGPRGASDTGDRAWAATRSAWGREARRGRHSLVASCSMAQRTFFAVSSNSFCLLLVSFAWK